MKPKYGDDNKFSQEFQNLEKRLNLMERRIKTEVFSNKSNKSHNLIEKDYNKYLDQDTFKPPIRKYSDIHSKPSPKPDIQAYIQSQLESQATTPQIPQRSQTPINENTYFLEMRQKLHLVFIFYASFGDRININYLHSNKLHKLLQDAELKNNFGLESRSIDLLFVKVNKHKSNMDFETFLQLLHQLSMIVYPNFSLETSLKQLLDTYFEPLWNNILTQTDLGEERAKFDQNISSKCINHLSINTIGKIYQEYFPVSFQEIKVKEENKKSNKTEQRIFLFLKEFDICPKLVTKGTAYMLLNYVNSIKYHFKILNENKQYLDIKFSINFNNPEFSFDQFYIYICKIAIAAYDQNYPTDKDDNDRVTQLSKLEFVIERMEMSQGYINLEEKFGPPDNGFFKLRQEDEQKQITLNKQNKFLSRSRNVTHVGTYLKTENEENYQNQNHLNVKKQNKNQLKQQQQVRTNSEKKKENQIKIGGSGTILKQIFDQYNQQLKAIFKFYCGTNQENLLYLVGSKFYKLMKDSNLICQQQSPLPNQEVDLIFTKSCQFNQKESEKKTPNGKNKKKMYYQSFLIAIEIIANKIYTKEIISIAVGKTIQEYLLPLSNKIIQPLVEQQIGEKWNFTQPTNPEQIQKCQEIFRN